MVALKPEPPKSEPERVLPAVEVFVAQSDATTLTVQTQGTVVPRTETVLTSEVSGKIEWVSPEFVDGGFFREGDVLVKVDSVNYEAGLANAEAQLAQAQLALAQETALSEQAKQDWEGLGRGEPSDLVLRKPQLRQARANVASAEAAVRLAKQNLDRTEVRAPYDGRIRMKQVDLGQTVAAGASQLAGIYSVDLAEVRLPLTAEQTAFVELPNRYRGETGSMANPGARVMLSANYGGALHTWEGQLDRTEGAIDSRNRMTYAVAQIEDPYRRSAEQPERPPLKVGMFVEALIEGRSLDLAYAIPRSALRDGNRVYLIDGENRLRSVELTIAKMDSNEAIVTRGLSDGDRICMTPLTFFVEGMEVLPVGLDGQLQETLQGGGDSPALAEANSSERTEEESL